jgi:hypothetical protein
MVRLRILCAAMLALVAVGAVTIPAGAADAPSAKFCTAYEKISGASGSNGATPGPKQAAALLAKFKAAGNQAPPKIKSAANTIVGVLSKIAHTNSSDAADLADFYQSKDFRKYGTAIGTFFSYASTCTSS